MSSEDKLMPAGELARETSGSTNRAIEVAERLATQWESVPYCMRENSVVDFLLLRADRTRAYWLEVKSRAMGTERYETCLIDMSKIEGLRQMQRMTGIRCFIAVDTYSGVYCIPTPGEGCAYEVKPARRGDREGDRTNLKMFIPWADFRLALSPDGADQ